MSKQHTLIPLFLAMGLGGCTATIEDPASTLSLQSQGTTDCSAYPEKRYFVEVQGWWIASPNEDEANNFGRLTLGTCFPIDQEVSGVLDFDLRVVLHNNPGTLHQIRPHIVDPGGQHSTGAVDNIDLDCPVDETCTFWFNTQVDTTESNYDGRQEFRFLTRVKEPDGQELRVSTSWMADLRNGGGRPVQDSRRVNYHEGRGWYDGADYQVARLEDEFPFEPLTEWNPRVRVRPGSGGGDVTSHSVHIDPKLEVGDWGTTLITGDGDLDERVEVPISELAPGEHSLVVRNISDCKDGECGSENDGQRLVSLFLIPFTVAGEVEPPAEDPPADDPPAEDPPAEDPPAEDPPAEDPPAEDPPAEDPPADDPPAEDPPADDPPADDPGVVELLPTADTFVRGGSASGDNFGDASSLIIKDASSDKYDRESYLRFDVAGLTSQSTTLLLDIRRLSNGSPVGLEVCVVPEAFVWSELELTYDNRSPECTTLATTVLTATGLMEIDLGTAIENLASNQLTLVLRDTENYNKMIEINSRESASPPLLILQ